MEIFFAVLAILVLLVFKGLSGSGVDLTDVTADESEEETIDVDIPAEKAVQTNWEIIGKFLHGGGINEN